jgi:hypothetical protein
MKVIGLKLVTGETVIGKWRETLDEDRYMIEDARRLDLVPNPRGGGGPALALSPLMMSNVEAGDFEFRKNHVVFAHPVDGEFEKQYLQQVSGIQLIN